MTITSQPFRMYPNLDIHLKRGIIHAMGFQSRAEKDSAYFGALAEVLHRRAMTGKLGGSAEIAPSKPKKSKQKRPKQAKGK